MPTQIKSETDGRLEPPDHSALWAARLGADMAVHLSQVPQRLRPLARQAMRRIKLVATRVAGDRAEATHATKQR